MNVEAGAGYGRSDRVLIGGAGPVGLLLANLLGRAGIPCTVLEQRTERPSTSMAIGITPPSLQILRGVGLDAGFVRRGIRVERAYVHENSEMLGDLSFDSLPGQYRYILSLPQAEGVDLLQRALGDYPCVSLRLGCEMLECRQDRDGVMVRARHDGSDITLSGSFLIGCDGNRSRIRHQAGITYRAKAYAPRFMMADFDDRTDFANTAHLFFGRWGSVESFPLPEGMRRWVVLAKPPEWEEEPLDVIRRRVLRQTGIDLDGLSHSQPNRFQPRRLLARSYARGRIVLCGDAAHVMSPIGGQGMNTGLADAELLATTLVRVVRGGEDAAPLLAAYSASRTSAFRIASARAARGMWLGTRTGTAGSACRKALIRHILMRASVRDALPAYFAMLDLPMHRAETGRSGR